MKGGRQGFGHLVTEGQIIAAELDMRFAPLVARQFSKDRNCIGLDRGQLFLCVRQTPSLRFECRINIRAVIFRQGNSLLIIATCGASH